MRLVLRSKASDDSDAVRRVVDLVEEGRPITASQIGRQLKMCEVMVTKIIHKHYDLGRPGRNRPLKMEWSLIARDPGRLQETLYTKRKDEDDVIEIE